MYVLDGNTVWKIACSIIQHENFKQKATFNYEIIESFETGIVLTGAGLKVLKMVGLI